MNEPDRTDEKSQRTWAMLAHLLALSGFIGVPFGNILGPLVIWLVKKNEMTFVDEQGSESLNFQISMTLYALICVPLMFIIIGIPLIIIVALMAFIFPIIAAVKANDGVHYRYPLTIRFVKPSSAVNHTVE